MSTLHRWVYLRRRLISSIPPLYSADVHANLLVASPNLFLNLCPQTTWKRWLSSEAEWAAQPEFAGMNAYDILGVSQNSSFAEIKTSFRKLAKETHPDLTQSQNHSSEASKKFIQILAAYEILSDSVKRANYDHHLLSRRTFVERESKRDTIIFNYNSYQYPEKEMEVVEWLRWYRYTIKDILSERRVTAGSGYFDILERDFYSAMRAAYYGPEIESMALLPECFEAEERSVHDTLEVLHLVSGRDLFGMICLTNRYSELSHPLGKKLMSSTSRMVEMVDDVSRQFHSDAVEDGNAQNHYINPKDHGSDAYRNLELHIAGRMVAMATRFPPRSCNAPEAEDSEDHIHVYLTGFEDSATPLGVIKGLGSTPEEGSCDVCDSDGTKTHVIMKHRTLLVKHLHWYRVGEKVSVCECRCSRARLPPSKFWLFEPRSAMHDVGGWYVETFGRDKKGKAVPAQRFWDGLDVNEHFNGRLHPAMYLIGLAYRTLDIEDLRRRKKTIKDRVEEKMSKALRWVRKIS